MWINNETTVRSAIQTQVAPTWFAPEDAFAIQMRPSTASNSVIQNDEEDEERFLESEADEQELMQYEVFEPRTLNREALDDRHPRSCRAEPSIFRQNCETGSTPERLPNAVPADAATWSISAPEIERAIITIFGQLKRAPSDSEIATELNLSLIHCHEGLVLLKDIETEIASLRADLLAPIWFRSAWGSNMPSFAVCDGSF
jgi:hypothetical protein